MFGSTPPWPWHSGVVTCCCSGLVPMLWPQSTWPPGQASGAWSRILFLTASDQALEGGPGAGARAWPLPFRFAAKGSSGRLINVPRAGEPQASEGGDRRALRHRWRDSLVTRRGDAPLGWPRDGISEPVQDAPSLWAFAGGIAVWAGLAPYIKKDRTPIACRFLDA